MTDFATIVQELRRKVEDKERPPTDSLLTASPFSAEVQDYRASTGFKLPDHPTYDGTGDPRHHVISFQAKMQVIGADASIICRAFFPTLVGPAQRWFLKLPAGSIGDFEELARLFLTHFARSMKPKKFVSDLSRVHQDEGESLRKYIVRWQKEAQAIDGLDDQIALTFFIESLRADGYYIKLRDKNPKTYAEAIKRANQLADTEEAVRQKRRLEGSSCKHPLVVSPREGRTLDLGNIRVRDHWVQDRLGAPAYQSTAQPVHEVHPELPPLLPIRPGDKPEVVGTTATRYCRYHRTNTHTMEECEGLKEEIETLINCGRPLSPNQWCRSGSQWQKEAPAPVAPRAYSRGGC
ncbi:PREDICTED: uncharacterized protein LOC109167889 [Ipomoea nil]|uniref:uncharacterized protein LOC109167889 n=1 Tax=Ipomoea nil TaxID=35883 RepID=UPI000900EBE9|nr:PREDICTED: uncharacterized protein LOC109167889 [Ipomoea nil]